MPSPAKFFVDSVTRVFSGFFDVDRAVVRFELLNGEISAPYERLCVERGDSANVLIYHLTKDAFILVRQFRYGCVRAGHPWLLESVAGKIDTGETPEEAAKREVMEEIGYRIQQVHPIASFYGSPGGVSEMQYTFFAAVNEVDRLTGGGGTDAGEDIEIVYLPREEALRQAKAGEIYDSKLLIGLLWFATAYPNGVYTDPGPSSTE